MKPKSNQYKSLLGLNKLPDLILPLLRQPIKQNEWQKKYGTKVEV